MRPDLQSSLAVWIRRLRIRRSLKWAVLGLAAGLGLGLLIAAYTFLTLDLVESEYILFAATAAGAGLAAAALAGLAWPVQPAWAARHFDRILGLKERVSTALESSTSDPETPLQARQAEDAAEHAARVDIRTAYPIEIPTRALLAALLLLAANLGAWYFGTPYFAAAGEKRQTRDTIQAQADQIEALIESIRNDPNLTDEQADQIVQPLEEALEALSEAETLEDAYSALEDAGESLQDLQDPGADALAEDLRQAGEALADNSSDALQPFAEALSQGDFNQAAEDLRNVDAAAMEQAELDQLADQLEALADAVETSDPDLAEQLREAAEAARSGDSQAAQQALEQAAQSLEDLQQQAAAGEASQAVEGSQQAIVQAGQEAGEGQQPDGTVAGNNGDSGSSGQGGEGGSGSQAGDGTGNENGSSGQEAGSDPIGQGNNPDGEGISGLQPITPTSIGGEDTDWVAVPPSGAEGDTVTGTGPSDPGNTAPITVPYTDVLPQYTDAANEAIDSGAIPPQYRDLVRDYFSSLEP